MEWNDNDREYMPLDILKAHQRTKDINEVLGAGFSFVVFRVFDGFMEYSIALLSYSPPFSKPDFSDSCLREEANR